MQALELQNPQYSALQSGHVFQCIDGHTCGNPVRLVLAGGPSLEGATIAEMRLDFLNRFDWIRTSLMFEPRGHDLMSGSILYPPHDSNNDFSVLFLETSGCLPMCGHGLIGTITMVIQEKLITPKTQGFLKIETPAGLIQATYLEENSKVQSVRILNVPSFLFRTDISVFISGLGEVILDVAYGGNFYAIVDVQDAFHGIDAYPAFQLIQWANEIRRKLNEQESFIHPLDSNIKSCSHVLFAGRTIHSESTARNAVVYGEKAIDRSPCGTGTSARMAQWFAKGKLKEGDRFIHESIIGTQFIGNVEQSLQIANYMAIRPSIQGWAKIHGYNTIIVDKQDDPLSHGFQIL